MALQAGVCQAPSFCAVQLLGEHGQQRMGASASAASVGGGAGGRAWAWASSDGTQGGGMRLAMAAWDGCHIMNGRRVPCDGRVSVCVSMTSNYILVVRQVRHLTTEAAASS